MLYIMTMITGFKIAPIHLEKKLMKEGNIKKAITIEYNKKIIEKHESDIYVTDLVNMYSGLPSWQFYGEKIHRRKLVLMKVLPKLVSHSQQY